MKPLMNTNRHRLIGYLAIVIILFFTTEAQSPQREDIEIIFKKAEYIPYQDEYEQMLYPTVRINSSSGTGSGVIIDCSSFFVGRSSEGTNHKQLTTNYDYILTAAHVVGDESKVTIELFYPKNIKIDAEVVITDTDKDLAFIKIRNSSLLQHFYSANLAPKNYQPYLFHHIYTIGCSLGLPPRPSEGIISAINSDSWEVSSPILPGNSGGPVFDAHTFEVIGIAVWVKVYNGQLVTTMAGIVPINQIYELLNKVVPASK